ncbi:hypothetical protein BO70DRAFT_17641 [Aspergillus heteromorphus CBS 117.55]|uniref:Uncharacterized protein n=1 Tax=Aspergillus heteromorphus CBS 117.55 TaxID=1448321 RepID=A0A317X541_9EURO|nr:uncharacterized protein BO70DRAFT_17641 [Aspergillus heteromorphus CBS 117.55]PWY92732.1 hypothetical protein BO70DRAFT_17641 [Aspergillus heteromorphus CBS 117.55]
MADGRRGQRWFVVVVKYQNCDPNTARHFSFFFIASRCRRCSFNLYGVQDDSPARSRASKRPATSNHTTVPGEVSLLPMSLSGVADRWPWLIKNRPGPCFWEGGGERKRRKTKKGKRKEKEGGGSGKEEKEGLINRTGNQIGRSKRRRGEQNEDRRSGCDVIAR